ncbi:hypothetical protein FA95DRAFT_1679750 [Auriscalpium vulgare]|uniref:Uncharacterized protein n=1 Tax=Auriscalpium vulgare TaxID=40419 RepID=A0ACB8RRX2_9AGAM|nr:hypothetical protein FA95DRAFT_1679750 [Auriscalpium vulgare]
MASGTDTEKAKTGTIGRGAGKHQSEPESDYGERSAKLWSVYVDESQKQDIALVESWKGDMDGLLIFAGLFSAVVTAFLVESLHLLQLDTGQTSVLLLQRISLQLEAETNSTTSIPSLPPTDNPSPAGSPLRVNILWSLSLLFSLLCALCATLIQQWARNYQQAVDRRSAPHQRARIRSFLFQGIEHSGAKAVVDGIPTLLHVAVFLFIAGMYDFITPSNQSVGLLTIIVLGVYGLLYVTISIIPIRALDSPYRTPLSAGIWRIKLLFFPLRFKDFRNNPVVVDSGNLAQGREMYAMRAAAGSSERDLRALSSTLASLTEQDEYEPFIEVYHA